MSRMDDLKSLAVLVAYAAVVAAVLYVIIALTH